MTWEGPRRLPCLRRGCQRHCRAAQRLGQAHQHEQSQTRPGTGQNRLELQRQHSAAAVSTYSFHHTGLRLLTTEKEGNMCKKKTGYLGRKGGVKEASGHPWSGTWGWRAGQAAARQVPSQLAVPSGKKRARQTPWTHRQNWKCFKKKY